MTTTVQQKIRVAIIGGHGRWGLLTNSNSWPQAYDVSFYNGDQVQRIVEADRHNGLDCVVAITDHIPHSAQKTLRALRAPVRWWNHSPMQLRKHFEETVGVVKTALRIVAADKPPVAATPPPAAPPASAAVDRATKAAQARAWTRDQDQAILVAVDEGKGDPLATMKAFITLNTGPARTFQGVAKRITDLAKTDKALRERVDSRLCYGLIKLKDTPLEGLGKRRSDAKIAEPAEAPKKYDAKPEPKAELAPAPPPPAAAPAPVEQPGRRDAIIRLATEIETLRQQLRDKEAAFDRLLGEGR